MKVNWFTVVAQIVNFLILVWLLKRFLYKPILDSIDERERKIASELSDAAAKEAAAAKEQDEFRRKNDEFDRKKEEMKDRAAADIKGERQRLLDEARKDAADLKRTLDAESRDAVERLKDEMVKRTQAGIIAVAEKALADLASADLEEQSVRTLIRRIQSLKTNEKNEFERAFAGDRKPLVVRSAFKLPRELRTELENAVDSLAGTGNVFRYELVPELICGVELVADGYKLEWSVPAYLESLNMEVSQSNGRTSAAETESDDA